MYDPCNGQKFGRISEKHMFDDTLSAQEKLIIAYINGKILATEDGRIELTKEIVAKLIGTKIGKNGKRSLSQAKRYMNGLRDKGIIETKKGQHTQWVWFKIPEGSNMDPLEKSEGSNMDPLNNSTIIKEKIKKSGAAAPDSAFKKHPNLDSFLEKIPFKLLVSKYVINQKLWDHGSPYAEYVLRLSKTKDIPSRYFKNGMENYLIKYLDSPEHACAGFRIGVMR